MKSNNTSLDLIDLIKNEADVCIKCGICIPHCPTYFVNQIEAESPRGRIALFKAIAENKIPITTHTSDYLDHCLSCRACEVVCPSQVKYGTILITGRNFLMGKNPQKNHLANILAKATLYPKFSNIIANLISFYQRSGLQKFLRKSKLLRFLGLNHLDSYLTEITKAYHLSASYLAQAEKKGTVALFTGCITRFIDQDTLYATIELLTISGFEVLVPSKQVCCGSLHWHSGARNSAESLLAKNRELFANLEVQAIITTASGCGAMLHENLGVSYPIYDIVYFLNTISPSRLVFKPLKKRVILHTPCTLKNVLQQNSAIISLLNHIPELNLIPIKNPYCCGAAGDNMLKYPTMANELVDNLIKEIITEKADILLTSNIGCRLHIKQRLQTRGITIEILHPVEILRKSLHN